MIIEEWIMINEPEVTEKEVAVAVAEMIQIVKRIERWKYC